jgi:hypothetical protein
MIRTGKSPFPLFVSGTLGKWKEMTRKEAVWLKCFYFLRNFPETGKQTGDIHFIPEGSRYFSHVQVPCKQVMSEYHLPLR